MLETPLRKSNRPFHRGFIESRMRKFERNWVGAVVICSVVAGCGDLPDLTVTADHKELCIHGKPGVELLDAKISNAGPGTVVLIGDSNKPWVAARPSLPLPKWVTPLRTGNTTTLKPGEFVSIPIKIVAPPHPDNEAYKLIIEVDPQKAYEEANENNNQYAVPVLSAPCG
jgi:hypothetical protein